MSIETLLSDRGIKFEKHRHAVTYTAQQLAREEHVSGYMVAKPVIVKTGNEFIMCVLPAPKHVDLRRIASLLHDDHARLATEAEMVDIFPDCDLGAEPPVGALFGLKTIMDRQLCEDEFLLMQAGSHTESIRLRRRDWEQLCEPVVADIV